MTKTATNYDDDDDDLLMALQSMEPCGNCGADGAKIPCMSGCGEVFYCSRVRFLSFLLSMMGLTERVTGGDLIC